MSDSQAIHTAALNYIEGWYQGDAERMRRALSHHLAKRRIVSADEIWHVDVSWMIQATEEGRGRIPDPSRGRREVTVLDQTQTMATVKIVSDQFVDYLHLSKHEDQWTIVNVLWDYHAKEE